jgi:8-oxo-dGTP diphosphatase
MIIYRKATADDVRPALELALQVFMKYQAPEYEPNGVVNFKNYCIEDKTYINSLSCGKNVMLIALDKDNIVGMIAERDNEILLLFVKESYHKKGIATVLLSDMICLLKLQGQDRMTLDSSTYALPFYLKYGFKQTGETRNHYGCVVTPMEYIPNEIWDVYDENRNLTGRYIERGRPKWQKGNYHLVVHVWKRNSKGEWLIDRRTPRKADNLGGLWEATGGSAVAGDSSLDAALRETKEELGLTLLPESGRLFHSYINKGFNGYTGFIDVWVFDCDCSLEDIVLQESETCDVMWASGDKIIKIVENGEFIGREIYPYLDKLLGYEV